MRNKRLLAIAAIAALLSVTSACGSDDKESATSGGPEEADMVVWLNGADTPQAARDWLKETFEKEHPGSTLTIEEQEWDGLVERLTTALSSEDQTPDVVEVGNTQAPTFTTAGAFSDLTDDLEELGGDDLLPGFVEGATVDGRTYAVPYYAGSTYVFYRKDLFDKAGLEVPRTMDEFVATATALKAANPQDDFSGYWLPGQDWRDGAAFLWDAGGDFAAPDGDGWKGTLSTPESIEGLTTFQTLFEDASGAPADANEADPVTPFCAGKIGMMSRPGWVMGLLTDPEAGCPDLAEKVGVFALPGSDGEPAPVLLGGSDIAVAAQTPNQDLARDIVALMLSDEYQGILAENGLTPARQSLTSLLGDDEFAQATIEAASNAKLTPAAANWATVEGTRILEDLFSQIAQGGDVEELAAEADERITAELN
ncbi:extracellular solute-binding protein [Nocardioides antri]|uniref:Extracellular solute-binding protein n=1 Tax=Nocardioides antri TaxID=2607659 RepID=A0A5B1LZR9_9ACTN|nr:extracellular solute-binding protein [Nocardioides antri]KAA1425994.1 extracellular solute-binding protein [Nocardioides antri]